MMYTHKYQEQDLSKYAFLVTGGAGFIGSNIVEYLLKNNAKKVRVLDNLATGFLKNMEAFQFHPAFEFLEGDIRDLDTCKKAMKGIDYVSHQAALGSVPRSIENPILTNDVNVGGFLNILVAQKESPTVKRLVYAASSSTYGDSPTLPKVEDNIGKPLSPYAVTKLVNELYADVFYKTYKTPTIGLRYFNVFGPKQSPTGAYAAVIPLFMQSLKDGKAPTIHGDGEQTRDFTFVENAVQANLRALFAPEKAINQVYNVAYGERISLNSLWNELQEIAKIKLDAVYGSNRAGDVRDSLADISKAKKQLDYKPRFSVREGLEKTWNLFSS
ncbi:MAG: LPS biosynthesis protein WbpP [Flavobacteriaceae bacterium CG02_land_8_20_14_3_00_34_13]|nr:SDR family oxidoreductase [Flavobacteriia bacterium]PIV48849.1 MAG: LPS biosynthesis protein WbpP [Flavobacteriaceae bacterium CG02_land_8_20_14_3_00_34_13]PIZ07139.1 MAG: LPS biosynthesis protein WbpP [Flavobacteriaceae bacterium CG_4_10_14_0_8_um_filter_34_31]PJC06153.1 MAG: LPS biosynthesis protein WbpP [Flavobacteriaceae bacterium CG_4_9_14_0_8_um_filter_34_30]